LKERVKKEWLKDEIVDYLNPIVPEIHYRNNKKVVKLRKLFPWYVFVNSKMNEKIWYIIRNTPGVRLIVWAEIHPIPLTEREYQNILNQIKEKTERADFAVPFKEWDIVMMKTWEFKWMKWKINEIDINKWYMYVNIDILWRSTPILVNFDNVEVIQ
jgi:transcriptional antiterminator NusG